MRLSEKNATQVRLSVLVMLVACGCLLVQMYALPYKMMFWMSMSNRIMLVMWFAVVVYSILVHGTKNVMAELAIFIFTIIAFLLSVSENTMKFSSSFTALLNFFALPLMMVYLSFNGIEEITKKTLLIANLFLSFIFIMLSRTRMAYRFEGPFFTVYTDELTLGYANPNQTAIYLFICAINLIVGFFYFRNRLIKLLFGADFLYMVYLMNETKCRTSILLIAVFIVLVIIHKIPKSFVSIAVIIPVVYAIMAQYLFPYFKDIRFMGEDIFNGREDLFGKYFEGLNIPRFLFGNFIKFEFANMHNAYISIAATAGIIVAVFYVLMLRKHLIMNREGGIPKGYQTVAFIGFICVIMYSSTEAAGMIGGTNYAFMSVSLLAYFSKPFAKS